MIIIGALEDIFYLLTYLEDILGNLLNFGAIVRLGIDTLIANCTTC